MSSGDENHQGTDSVGYLNAINGDDRVTTGLVHDSLTAEVDVWTSSHRSCGILEVGNLLSNKLISFLLLLLLLLLSSSSLPSLLLLTSRFLSFIIAWLLLFSNESIDDSASCNFSKNCKRTAPAPLFISLLGNKSNNYVLPFPFLHFACLVRLSH